MWKHTSLFIWWENDLHCYATMLCLYAAMSICAVISNLAGVCGMTFWDISVMYNELFFYWHFEFTLWQCWIEYQSWIKFQRWGTSIVSKACLQPYWSNFTTHLKIPLLFSWGLEGFARHPFLHFQGCQYLYYSSFPHVPSLPLYFSPSISPPPLTSGICALDTDGDYRKPGEAENLKMDFCFT